MKRNQWAKIPALLPGALVGCATVDPRADWDRAEERVIHASGETELYRPDEHSAVAKRVATLIADGLTVGESVQVALLNNPRLQGAVYRLGISRAEFVQSSLFSNPSLTFSMRFPDGGGLTNLQAGIAQNLAEVWQIKHRKAAAQRDLDRAILDLAREASLLVFDVRAAYWQAVRAQREQDLARENLTLAGELIEVTVSRRDSGAGSDVDVNLALSQQIDFELKLRSTTLAAIEAQSAFCKLLGISAPPSTVVLGEKLGEPGEWTLDAERVISAGLESRLDLQAARMAVEEARLRVAYEKSRFLRTLELGISAERSARSDRGDRDWLAETAFASAQSGQLTAPSLQPRDQLSTDWVVGPEIGVELPIFDQNQAQIARAEFVHQQALRMLDTLERELVQDAHVAYQRARNAAENARFFREKGLPLREKGLALAQGAYTAGRTTLLAVQESQRALLSARFGYVEALTQYALAVVELERVGGRPFEKLVEHTAHQTKDPDSTVPHSKEEETAEEKP